MDFGGEIEKTNSWLQNIRHGDDLVVQNKLCTWVMWFGCFHDRKERLTT